MGKEGIDLKYRIERGKQQIEIELEFAKEENEEIVQEIRDRLKDIYMRGIADV